MHDTFVTQWTFIITKQVGTYWKCGNYSSEYKNTVIIKSFGIVRLCLIKCSEML